MSSFNHAFCYNELSSFPWKWGMLMNGAFQHRASWKHLLCMGHLQLAHLLMPLRHINVSRHGHLLIRRGTRGRSLMLLAFRVSTLMSLTQGYEDSEKHPPGFLCRSISCLLCLRPNLNAHGLSSPLQWFLMWALQILGAVFWGLGSVIT